LVSISATKLLSEVFPRAIPHEITVVDPVFGIALEIFVCATAIGELGIGMASFFKIPLQVLRWLYFLFFLSATSYRISLFYGSNVDQCPCMGSLPRIFPQLSSLFDLTLNVFLVWIAATLLLDLHYSRTRR
jgi:hypothetical protein